LRVTFCGVRGSTAAPGNEFVRYGGHTSCVALAHTGAPRPTLLLDAGVGLQRVTRLLEPEPFIGTILLSHLHWDHVLGLPFFAAAVRNDSTVAITLPDQGNGKDAAGVLAGMMAPPYFPVGPTQLRGRWSFSTIAPGEHEIEGFSVLAREVPHKGGRTFGYRISDGHSTLTYIPDHCPTSLGPGEHGFGVYHETALELARETDALVHDAQLLPSELAAEADFGHSVGDYALELGKLAGARSVIFFHHRYNRTDEALDEVANRFNDADPPVRVACENTVLEL
jgi:phosphoribosyl 1,2-cyclic phosphodiesterase